MIELTLIALIVLGGAGLITAAISTLFELAEVRRFRAECAGRAYAERHTETEANA